MERWIAVLAACLVTLTATGASARADDEDRPGVSAAAEFAAVCAGFRDGDTDYYGRAPLRRLTAERDAETAATPAPERVRRRVQLGWEQLKLGEPVSAIDTLAEALELLGDAPGSGPVRRRTTAMMVIAHLQAAEDENCVDRHTAGSCILPIGDDGIHRIPKHARLAGDLSLELLTLQRPVPTLLWSLNLARMVAGDYPQGVPERFRLPEAAFTFGESFPRWIDRAPDLGVAVTDLAGGAIVDDFDGDGLLDLVSSTWDPCGSLRAFRNDGRGGFDDVTAAWGLDVQLGGLNVIHGDYDNDGRIDLFVLRGGWLHDDGRVRNSLLRNTAAGGGVRFVDVTRRLGLAEPAYPTQTGAWADYDSDGDLDLYVGNEGSGTRAYPSQLFRNDGDRFTDVADEAGVSNDRYTKAVAWGDYDNDGDPDLYVSTNNTPNRLYRNKGDGTFEDVAAELGVTRPHKRSFATWFVDVDNDGWLDLFVGNFESPPGKVMAAYFGRTQPGADSGAPLIYLNVGGPAGRRFVDGSARLGLERPQMPMGANHGDLDNDGWPDFYLGTGEPAFEAQVPNAMYRNVAGQRYADVTFAGGFGHIQKGHGVAFGDIDQDGDQDIFHQIGGFYPGDAFGNALFENPGNDHRWLTLRLEGVEANRSAIGARLAVTVRDGADTRVVHALAGSGGSFGGNSLQQELGLGAAQTVEVIEIRWPGSNTVQRLPGVPVNGVYRIREDADRAVPVATRAIALIDRAGTDGHHEHH